MSTDLFLNLVERLRAETEKCLLPHINFAMPYALLDFPDYDNVGDSAIFVGQWDFFNRSGRAPDYVSSIFSNNWAKVDEIARNDGAILLQGGGNFGDIWPFFQSFREEVIERYPDNPIIQLPQTIHFDDSRNLEASARSISKHKNFKLFVRDFDSLSIARKHFDCEAFLAPDMAFCMNRRKRHDAQQGVLLHLRSDKESGLVEDLPPRSDGTPYRVEDWPTDHRFLHQFARMQAILSFPTSDEFALSPIAYRNYEYYVKARIRLSRGEKLLNSATSVVTDRLHGHIMSLILGKPHAVLDNSYGKIARFASAWGTLGQHVRQLDDLTSLDEYLLSEAR